MEDAPPSNRKTPVTTSKMRGHYVRCLSCPEPACHRPQSSEAASSLACFSGAQPAVSSPSACPFVTVLFQLTQHTAWAPERLNSGLRVSPKTSLLGQPWWANTRISWPLAPRHSTPSCGQASAQEGTAFEPQRKIEGQIGAAIWTTETPKIALSNPITDSSRKRLIPVPPRNLPLCLRPYLD